MANKQRRRAQRGLTVIEMLIAMVVLAVALGGIAILFSGTFSTTSSNNRDTSATFLAKMVVEAISAQHPNANANIPVTDCQGNTWNINPTPAAYPGAGATLVTSSTSSNYGYIDQTQALSNVPSGYSMQYQDCGTAGDGSAVIYDVRWNVMTITANQTRMVTAAAHIKGVPSTQLGGLRFAAPVNLRGIAGP